MKSHADFEDDSWQNSEDRQFRRYRSEEGTIESLDIVRRNGIGVPRPAGPDPRDTVQSRFVVLLRTYRVLMYNLTSIERRVWVRLLLGASMDDVASMFGVSRPAIYCRIRGDGKGYRGMIGKNQNVRIWWDRRQQGG